MTINPGGEAASVSGSAAILYIVNDDADNEDKDNVWPLGHGFDIS